MYSRPFFKVLFVLFLSLHAVSAPINVRSIQISETGATLESTTETELSSPPPNDPSAKLAALCPRSNRNNDLDEPYDADADASRIDRRGDDSLRLESMPEAVFLPSTFENDE